MQKGSAVLCYFPGLNLRLYSPHIPSHLSIVSFFLSLSTYFILRSVERFALRLQAVAHTVSLAADSVQRTLLTHSFLTGRRVFHSRSGISTSYAAACGISTRLQNMHDTSALKDS
jgi:hypothetical protein